MKISILLQIILSCALLSEGIRYTLWDSDIENAWSIDFFTGNGKAPDDVHTSDGTGSIFFQVIQYGGVTIRHDYTTVNVANYWYLNFKFYTEDPTCQYELQVSIKQQGEVWTNFIDYKNLTLGEWNWISVDLGALNWVSDNINQVQIQKVDRYTCDAWIDAVYFTDQGHDFDADYIPGDSSTAITSSANSLRPPFFFRGN